MEIWNYNSFINIYPVDIGGDMGGNMEVTSGVKMISLIWGALDIRVMTCHDMS